MHWIDWLLLLWLGWYCWEGYRRGAVAWQQLAVMVVAMTAAGFIWQGLLQEPLAAWSPLLRLTLLLALFLICTLLLGLLLEYWQAKRVGKQRTERPGWSGLLAGLFKWAVLLLIFLLLTRLLDSDNQLQLLLNRSLLLKVVDVAATLGAPWLGLVTASTI